ncbi:UNVERIFIED_CONTAM: protein BONZAI 1 [Sesamum calycinum]|uniref:Protein BONZAI 1 n=1 Tax=Sesamum calycinum TaxID=2727403 RepID=A0AAW2SYH9_9LAMI
MGNCCSDVAGGQSAVGGTISSSAGNAPNEAVDAFLRSRGYNGLFSQIELSLSAANLRDRDVLSKSDPMAVIYMKGSDGSLQELGRTEVVLNSLNPKWIRKYTLTYQFEMVQTLVFRVYDVDTQFQNIDVKALKLEEQQFLGEASCTLSEIVTKSNRILTLDLAHEGVSAPAHTRKSGQLMVYAEESVSSKTTAEMILRCSDLESKDLFSKSDPFLVISKITESGILVPICKTEVLKNDHNPKWKQIFLSIQQVGSKVLKSQLFVDKYSENIQHTFLDYLAGGYELNFMVAIDFTASNGNPRLPDSLHYIDPSGRPNAYQRAILEVGGVLQFYDSDRKFPAWGFGARPIDGPVSHCFNLNGSSSYCEDGVITDLQETKDAFVMASDLPLSILIVGVGGADFKEMEILDADKGDRLESSTGRVASRDIVQFVPFRDVQSGEVSVVQSLLAELPSQFLTYVRARGLGCMEYGYSSPSETRKAVFYVRVLSGYEERRIRSYRLQLQQRLQQAQQKKAALKQVPEQIILSEMRRMVEDMQSLNKKLEETAISDISSLSVALVEYFADCQQEAAIEEYFKPIDKEAEIIMKMQLEGEEKTMREMMTAMQRQALLEKAEAEKFPNLQNAKTDKHIQEPTGADKSAQRR